ncbi:MAG: ABC transporter ATP-binding protein [Selenomonadaceae bacterium]|nr:ABC transporter ATP-binding protein [Selenomonadaceae bacterium]
MSEKIIEINNITVKFNMMKERVDSLKEYMVRFLKGNLAVDAFYALQNISFDINKGDVVGFIGLNGAGKSTLLKVLAGVLKPTNGNVVVKGSVAPLIEVGAGFDGELTARENVYLNGVILGHTKKFLDEHLDRIIDFAELRDFMDVPVKNFSSGMYARLGFAIATEVQPDVLIVDEVLSVGDFKFQQKCENRIQNMIAKGTTVIIVSHSIDLISKLCNKVAWLDHGKLLKYGDAKEICESYEPSEMRGCSTRGIFYDGSKVIQYIFVNKKIKEIQIRPITWKNKYDDEMLLASLKDNNGEKIKNWSVSLNSFIDNTWYGLELEDNVIHSEGVYYLEISIDKKDDWSEKFQLLTTIKDDKNIYNIINNGKRENWHLCINLK